MGEPFLESRGCSGDPDFDLAPPPPQTDEERLSSRSPGADVVESNLMTGWGGGTSGLDIR